VSVRTEHESSRCHANRAVATLRGAVQVSEQVVVGGTDDDQDGYHCPEPAIRQVTEDLGKGAVDPTRPG
jgi:hypothetical protein